MKAKTTRFSVCMTVFGRQASMKVLLPLIMILAFAVGAADQKDEDLATVVIQSEFHAGYNPLNSSEEELNKADVFNSGLRLQYIFLHEVSDQELKVCYALRVLDSQMTTFRRLASENNNGAVKDLTVLLQRQTELVKQLRAIQERKAGGKPFDEVIWVEHSKPDISLLYVVLTDAGGYDSNVRLVVSHASAALTEAVKHQGHEFNVVFFVRTSADTRKGASSGFGVEQIREIAAASPKRAEELVRQHAWTIGELQK